MQKDQKSGFDKAISCFFLILLILMVELPAIFMAGSDHIIPKAPHQLYAVFKENDYENLISFINDNQYTQIITNESSNMKQFLNYFSSLRQKNEIMYIREYSYHPHKVFLRWFRMIKNLIEDHLDEFKQDSRLKQTWVLVGIQEEVPEKDVIQLMERFPDSKVILVTKKFIKVQCASCKKGKFQQLAFPQITNQNLLKTIQSQFGLSVNASSFLVNFYDSNDDVGRLFTALNKSKLLQNQYYRNISQLNGEQRKILEDLCNNQEQTDIKLEDVNSKKLQEYGVIFIDGKFQWRNSNFILNYALQTQSNCLISQLDKEILERYDKQKRVISQQQKEWQQNLQIFIKRQNGVSFDSQQNEKKQVISRSQSRNKRKNRRTKRKV